MRGPGPRPSRRSSAPPQSPAGPRHGSPRRGTSRTPRTKRDRDTFGTGNPRLPRPGWRGRRYLAAGFHFRGASVRAMPGPGSSRRERRGAAPLKHLGLPGHAERSDPPPVSFIRGTGSGPAAPRAATALGEAAGRQSPVRAGRGPPPPDPPYPRGAAEEGRWQRRPGTAAGPGQRHCGTAGPGRPSPSPRPAPGSRRAVRAARRRTACPRLQHG